MDMVQEGDYIAYLQNSANISDVQTVSKVLERFEQVTFREDGLYHSQTHSLQSLLTKQEHMFENPQNKLRPEYENLKVVQSFLARDTSLYADKVISKAGYGLPQISYFNTQLSAGS